MKKSIIIAGILIFILATLIVLTSDTSSRKKIGFTNRNFVINNENAQVKSEDVQLSLNNSRISNKDIDINSTQINDVNIKTDFNNSNNFENQDVRFSNNEAEFNNNSFNNQNVEFDNQQTNIDPYLTKYENQQNQLQNFQNDLQNRQYEQSNPKKEDQYIYKNINWNTWKSNFVNKIIDDSMYIRSLDTYSVGTWFYYSFVVTKNGEIRNVKVQSMYLTEEDKSRVAQLIRSYAHKPITKFPKNSNRATAKVDAVVLLGNTEKKSNPSDFNDNEKVKIHLPY